MSEPKKHHFVSQFLLRNFTNDAGQLCYYSRHNPSNVGCSKPENLFFERHLFSSISTDGRKDARLEKAYSTLEGLAKPVVDKIITRARANYAPNFAPNELGRLNKFLYHHIKRSPDFVIRIGGENALRRNLEKAMEEYQSTIRPLSDEEKAVLAKPEEQKRMYQNALVLARARGGGTAIREAFKSRGLGVARILDLKKSFIIGSFPYASLAAPGVMGGPIGTAEMWIPIASDIALTVFGLPRSVSLVSIPETKIRAINESLARQSSAIAGRAPNLIRSLSGLMRGPIISAV